MTPTQAQLCEWLRSIQTKYADKCADKIESQAKQIAGYIEQHGRDSAELRRLCGERDTAKACIKMHALEYTSLFDQCSEALDRVKALEAKCALMAASLAQEEAHSAELEAKVAAAEKATRFAGLVLAQHRNDGYPGDVDGDDLQRFALESGMIEERLVESSCGSECSCADVGEFPTTCYFNTEAGKAAIAASKEQS